MQGTLFLFGVDLDETDFSNSSGAVKSVDNDHAAYSILRSHIGDGVIVLAITCSVFIAFIN